MEVPLQSFRQHRTEHLSHWLHLPRGLPRWFEPDERQPGVTFAVANAHTDPNSYPNPDAHSNSYANAFSFTNPDGQSLRHRERSGIEHLDKWSHDQLVHLSSS